MENQDQVLRFLSLICDPHGQNLSARHLTVSTCGIVPGILRFAEEKRQINLAISLHAPTQEKRQMLMPVARKYDLPSLMQACKIYFQKTGRQITFEYALIAGQNDADSDAKQLADLLKDFNCLVNLIPVNPVRERSFQASSRRAALLFQKNLEKNGINVTIRREMGQDIDGACGQLRRRVMTQQI